MRPLLVRIRALPWPKDVVIPPGGIRPSELSAVPIEKVPKRIRDALPHPAPFNTCWDDEYQYELTHRYLWRTRLSHVRAQQQKLLDALEEIRTAGGFPPS
jgi:hypothetical protein